MVRWPNAPLVDVNRFNDDRTYLFVRREGLMQYFTDILSKWHERLKTPGCVQDIWGILVVRQILSLGQFCVILAVTGECDVFTIAQIGLRNHLPP